MAPVQAPEVSLGDAAAAPGEEADSEITLEQFTEQLRRIDKTLRALPATAQARPRAALFRNFQLHVAHCGALVAR